MIVKFVSNVRKQNKFAVSSNEIPPWNRLETKDIENNWRTESIQLELSFFLSFLLLKLEREIERNETKASKPLCPTFLQFTFVYIRDIHRANVPIKANSPQLAERDECCSWPFREWRGIPFPPPSYSARQKSKVAKMRKRERWPIVVSTKGLAIHHCQQRGCREQMELEWQLWQLPRGNPRFYMHSLISLSEIYGGRGLRHFSYREHDGLSVPFNCLFTRNCLFSKFLSFVSSYPQCTLLFLHSSSLQFIIPRYKL